MLCSGGGDGGGGGDEPDGGESALADGHDDDNKKAFKALKERTQKCRPYHLRQTIQLIREISRFACKHPDYSIESFKLLTKLIAYESLALIMLTKMGLNLALAYSSFDQLGIAIVYAFLVMVGDVMAAVVPWVLPAQDMSTLIIIFIGSAILTATDNGFAHIANSSQALEWDSPELVNYGSRVYVLAAGGLLVLDGLYSRLIMEKLMAGYVLRKHLLPLLAADFFIKPVASYFVEAAYLTKIPYFALFTIPNPLAPHSFPFPKYCPDPNWLPWPPVCPDGNTTLPDNSCSEAGNETDYLYADDE